MEALSDTTRARAAVLKERAAVILRPVPFDDDAADDVTGFRPPPHPDDRLWRHPSEVYAAEPATQLRTHGRLWPWGIAAVGTAGVMLAGAGTLILGVRDRVTDGDPQQQAAVTPLGPLPSPHVNGQRLAPRSSEGVTDLADIARLADQLAPSLVRIDVAGVTGSGVVLGADGVTLTSAELVEGLEQVPVTLHDGRQVTGQVKGTDPLTGIAVLDLPGSPTVAAMADPTEVAANEGVLAMGATGEGRPATTLGPLSSGHRRLERTGHAPVDGLLHVEVPAQPEARGGPLVDQQGTVIGITIWTGDDTCATPIDVAAKVADDVLNSGRARHGWLGIGGRDVSAAAGADGSGNDCGEGVEGSEQASTLAADPADAAASSGTNHEGDSDRTTGVVVVSVDPSGPAVGELETGDVITRVDDQPVDDMADLADAVRLMSPGETVAVTIDRDGARTVEITLAPRPDDP